MEYDVQMTLAAMLNRLEQFDCQGGAFDRMAARIQALEADNAALRARVVQLEMKHADASAEQLKRIADLLQHGIPVERVP